MTNTPIQLKQLTPATADATKLQLRQSAEVQQIAHRLNIKNQLEIMAFGQEPTTKLARFSDRILSILAKSSVNDSGDVMKQLESLMQKFDKKELIEQKSFLGKLFKRKKSNKDDLYTKYNGLGREIEKMHYQFVLMEDALASDNRMLARLYQENLIYYMELEKYIVAAEMKWDEVTSTLIPMCEKQSEAGNQMARIELNSLKVIADRLSQKIEELEKSRMVAILAAPQIEMIRNGNHTLMEQINGAFVQTIPVFKMAIMNAVNEKRQQLQQDSAAAFEKRMKQYSGVSDEAIQLSTAMATQPEKGPTLEEMWDTILIGISNYRQLRDEQTAQCRQTEQQLLAIHR